MASSSQKKQQSISNFFTKGPASSKPAASQKVPLHPPKKDSAILASSNTIINGRDYGTSPTLSDDEERITTKRRQRRGNHEDEDGENIDYNGFELPKPKRLKKNSSLERKSTPSEGRGSSEEGEGAHTNSNGQNVLHDATIGTSNGIKQPKVSDRTSKYLFTSSPAKELEDAEADETEKRRRGKLHEKFVQKLGKPDSIAEIKRRNGHIEDETGGAEDGEDDGEEEQEEEVAKPAKKGRSALGTKKGGSKLTPMEKQVVEIKRSHMDTVLVVEVGYKFRFFGEDARIAAKELSIVCIPGKFRFDEHPSEAHIDRFASASIPVHRLHVHVKRLVTAGHKVGVVRQLETAALKAAGDNRNAPFVRKLTNLYTKGTYIDDAEGMEGSIQGPSGGAPATGYLLCITETNAKGWGNDEKVQVGIVAVQPATGDVIYDDFEDGFMRSEIETRLLHIAPCEFLIVGDLSKATEKLIQHLSGTKTNVFGDKSRVESVPKQKTIAAQSHSHVSSFYAGKMKGTEPGLAGDTSNLLDRVLSLPENVTICLSAMIKHMEEYGLEHVFDLTKYFQSFSARSHMLLNGNTLTSLEIYQNQTDHTEKGSLFWILDRTQTRFGQRLMRKWVGRPLLDKQKLEERVGAVEELQSTERTALVDKLKRLISRVKSDLEKSLIRIYYGKCTRPELLTVLQTMQLIANEFIHIKNPKDAGFDSSIINEAIAALPTISEDIVSYLDKINGHAAKSDDKYAFFRDSEETEDITEHKLGIASVEYELDEHRTVAAEKIRQKKVEYVTVGGIEYLIEVNNSPAQIKNVPASWAKISGTKKVSRFHTPEVVKLMRERDQHKEALAAACDKAFASLLEDISTKYQSFRDCIQALATLDCLLSLAKIAAQPGYVKPRYTDEICISVEQGRHPMVEQLLLGTYVPNDTNLSSDDTRALLVTGPNMGGKSSYVRQLALIAIMGQIGSYVPAKSATLGMLDAVFTRMGAFDNMMAGESTFMVELSETSDILKQASPRSLVILDELGRGTSTHDGVAIAQAVLDYLVREIKALTLFITHYQNLATLSKSFDQGELKNVHMRFEEGDEDANGVQNITFLYEVADGVAHRSYGLNVAHLANVPKSVLEVAATKSKQLEETIREKKMLSSANGLKRVLDGKSETSDLILESLVNAIEQL